jgi:hypothetical protein
VIRCNHTREPYAPPCAVCSRLHFEAAHELDGPQRDPLNVDAMTPSELQECAVNPFVHPEVRSYAAILVHAVKKRLEGSIESASKAEARAQEVYSRLIPKQLRW